VNRPQLQFPTGRIRILALLTLVLIGLGSFVRATGAGLACPDWPLCFGRAIPEFQYGVAQEVIHRYVAGIAMLLTLSLVWTGYRMGRQSKLFRISLALFILICIQAVFGGLTVTMKLNPLVVTTHLALGTLFFQLVALFGFSRPVAVSASSVPPNANPLRRTTLCVAALTYLQILIGGFTAASGAALSCPGFPLCGTESFSPEIYGPQIFQMTHRILGVLLLIALVLAVRQSRRLEGPLGRRCRRALIRTVSLVALQVGLGWLNLHLLISPSVTVLHVIVAQGILIHLLLLWRWLTPGSAAEEMEMNHFTLSRAA